MPGWKTSSAGLGQAPEDIAAIFRPVLSHRVRLSHAALYAGKKLEDILRAILEETPVPPEGAERFREAKRL